MAARLGGPQSAVGVGFIDCTRQVGKDRDMQLKDFSKFLRRKSIPQLLHRARKNSLERIMASGEDLETPRKTVQPKRTGTR